jgi:D-alanyl-D-alanine carboxypeptidase
MRLKTVTTRTVALAFLAGSFSATPALATPSLVADLVTGEVLLQEDAARPWYPASLTKLMTAYVALKAVKLGKVTLDTPFVVSARAARAAPSKMGFNPGTEVTLDNALKMLMVKSANDIAVTIAEGLGGSVEDFANEMNSAAAALGMSQSHFVNPNGLHDPEHVSSARDMAILARALYLDFPQQADLYGIGALKLGDKVIPTHNGLIGRYPGADGMKTGFVCASGFNVVASAQRGGRHLVVVVMGSPNAKARTIKAAHLFDNGFSAGTSWRAKTLSSLQPIAGPAPNMRPEICGKNRKVVQEDDLAMVAPANGQPDDSAAAFFASDGRAQARAVFTMGPRPQFEPVEIFVGRRPGWTGPVAMARQAPGGTMIPANAAAFADPRPVMPPAMAGAAGTAMPLGLSGAARGIGAVTTRAIEVKSRAEIKKSKPPARAAAASGPDLGTDAKPSAKPIAKPSAKPAAKTSKPAPKVTAAKPKKPETKSPAKADAVKVSDSKARPKSRTE